MKRIFAGILFLCMLILPAFGMAAETAPDIPVNVIQVETVAEAPDLQAQSAILIDEQMGKVLYEKNAGDRRYPASTTKMLTALLALENGNLKDVITVGPEVGFIKKDSSMAGLDRGEKITLENLLRGLLLPSGNDAAEAIGVYIGRKISKNDKMPPQDALHTFVNLMNQKAKELGAENSHFVNPHGYHDVNHYTTAYDLAVIARTAMEQPFFREVVKTQLYTIEDWNQHDKKDPKKKALRKWKNSNLLIEESDKKHYFPYATGIKTGHTSEAGYCLVASAAKEDLNFISVVLDSSKEGRWNDSTALLEYGLTNFFHYSPVKKGQVVESILVTNQAPEDLGSLDAVAAKGFTDLFYREDTDRIQKEVTWNPELVAALQETGESALVAPIQKNQHLGTVSYRLDDKIIFQCDLLASRDVAEKVEVKKPTAVSVESALWQWIISGIILLAALIGVIYFMVKNRRR